MKRPLLGLLVALVGLALAGCSGSMSAATNVTQTSATLNATGKCGDTGNHSGNCYWKWQWGTGRQFQYESAQAGPAGATGKNPVPLHYDITRLQPGTSYQARLCGKGDGNNGWACTDSVSFTTLRSPCTRTLSPGASVQNALSSAAPGSVVCLAAGTWSRQTLSGIAPSSTVTLRPAPGATVRVNGITVSGSNTKNLLIEGFYVDGPVRGTCGVSGGLTFKYNTIQNLSKDYAFWFYANGCGSGHTQTGVSMLNNQIDHVGDCLTVAGGEGVEANFTFSHNVCGPGIGKGATTSSDPSHYIEIGGIGGVTVDNNAFEGPMDSNYISAQLHNNVFHIFGGASNVDFSNNIVWHTESRAQTMLLQEGGYDNVTVNNNLFVEDPGCFQNTACYTETMEIYAPHGLTVKGNTVEDTGLGLRFGETCSNGCYPSGNNMTLQNNIVEPRSGQASNYAIWSCASVCTADHNVSADTSAPGSSSVTNWTPRFGSTGWTPTNGEPYSAPPAGYYQPTGLGFTAGWGWLIGPQGGVGARAFR